MAGQARADDDPIRCSPTAPRAADPEPRRRPSTLACTHVNRDLPSPSCRLPHESCLLSHGGVGAEMRRALRSAGCARAMAGGSRPATHQQRWSPVTRLHRSLLDRLTENTLRAISRPASSGCRTTATIVPMQDRKQPYVVWNVVAAPELLGSPATWCFPIAGCVAYRTATSRRTARRNLQTRWKRSGASILTSAAWPPYSTLGKFQDPVLSTMLGYGDDEACGDHLSRAVTSAHLRAQGFGVQRGVRHPQWSRRA